MSRAWKSSCEKPRAKRSTKPQSSDQGRLQNVQGAERTGRNTPDTPARFARVTRRVVEALAFQPHPKHGPIA